jgi:hypothetical protein
VPQLTRNARKPLDLIDDALKRLEALRDEIYQEAVGNPRYVMQLVKRDMAQTLDQIREQRRQLEPLLERQAPEYERRLAELERWREEVEQGNVTRLRRKAE